MTTAPDRVDRFDWEILDFVVQWAPYGGPAEEEVLPRFGMTREQLQARFSDVVMELTSRRRLRLTAEQRQLLGNAVALHLAAGAEPERPRRGRRARRPARAGRRG